MIISTRRTSSLALAALVAATSLAGAQSVNPPSAGSSAGVAGTRASGPDAQGNTAEDRDLDSKEFVTKATQSNLAEISVSRLALTKSSDPHVKQYAQRMIDDHQKANAQLAPIAQAKNLTVPDDTDLMHKASAKLLENRTGKEFDTSYMEQMKKDHDKTVALFRSAAASTRLDPELKAFAAKLLPTLQDHNMEATHVAAESTPAKNR